MTLDSEQARALGSKGGQRSGQRRKRLTLSDVEADLPPLDSVEHAKERLARISTWSVAGLIDGSKAGAAVRAHEIWLRLHDSELDRQRMKELETRVKELEAELGQRSALRRLP